MIDQSWEAKLLEEEKSENTIRAYSTQLKLFKEWFEGSDRNKERGSEEFIPKNVTSYDMRDYKSYLLNNKHRKGQTINLAINAIKSWLHFHDKTVQSPKTIKIQLNPPKWLTKLEINAVMRTVEKTGNKRDIALLTFMLNSGLRVEEVADVQIPDLFMSERKGHVLVRNGKGEKERTVPLNNDARNALRDYIGTRKDGPVFLSQRGRYSKGITKGGIALIINKYSEASKVKMSPHTLRHCFAKELLNCGNDLSVVSRLLGHENLNTTARYTEPSQDDMQKAVDRISVT